MTTLQARFEDKYTPVPEAGCWIWTASLDSRGYGKIVMNGRHTGAHRVSWVLHKGEIPEGMYVCHACDNPACVNPDHLFLGTHQDNMDDMARKGRRAGPINGENAGEKNGRAKLTEEDVIAIRRDTRPYKDIASCYEVAASLISGIKNNKRWRCVPHE